VVVCGHITALHQHCKPPHEHLDWTLGEVIADYCAELFVRWAARVGKGGVGRAGAHGAAGVGKAGAHAAAGEAAPKSFAEAAVAAGSSLYALAARWNKSKKRGSATAYVESALPIVTGILGLD